MLNLTLLLPLLARAEEVIEMNACKADRGENVRVAPLAWRGALPFRRGHRMRVGS
jgi:hypothetical protein